MNATPATLRLGLIGSHLDSRVDPVMHEREADALGLTCSYERIDIEEIGLAPERVGELLRVAQGLGFRGVNITHPCEQLVIPHLAGLSSDAAAVGAVDTVVFTDAGAIGHNTCCLGFRESFARGLPKARTDRVLLVGAGGGGAACGHAALSLGTERLWLVDARPEQAERLARLLCRRHGRGRAVAIERVEDVIPRADGLIHATPTGTSSRPGIPFAAELLHDGLWVAEAVYRPPETELLRLARRRGCRTLGGAGGAVHRTALSFALFTGEKPDHERMLRHLTALLDHESAVVACSEPG